MRKFTVVVIALFLGALSMPLFSQSVNLEGAIRLSVDSLSQKIDKGAKVAVLDAQTDSKALSDFIIEEIAMALVNSKHVTVVDRKDMDLAKKEMEFQLSGEVSDESALSIGKKLGAQSIITCSLTNLGNSYRYRLKTVDVQTSAIRDLYAVTITDVSLISFLVKPDQATGNTAFASGKPVKKTPAKPGNFEIIPGKLISLPINRAKFKDAALEALSTLGYTVLSSDRDGVISARLKESSWWVEIRVCYWDDEYWFEYVDSLNLDANPAKDVIHRNYRRWIPNLDKNISLKYSE
jgi:TolB-like protein